MEIKIKRLRRNHHGIKCLFEDNYKINVWFYLLKISTNMFMLKMEFSIFTLHLYISIGKKLEAILLH
jgi:hypothetical protein